MAYRRTGGTPRRLGGGRADPAVRRARSVIGLYGDPDVSWSIVLEARPTTPVDPLSMAERLRVLAERYPALGRPAVVERVGETAIGSLRRAFANTSYDDHAPLVRAAVTGSGTTVLLAAHHGAVDGLGLVAVLNAALGSDLVGEARGVATSRARRSFPTGAARRLGEALFRPPSRFRTDGGAGGDRADHLAAVDVRADHLSTAALLVAARTAFERWNDAAAGGAVVVAVGASRRPPGTPLRPDRATAYLRVVLPAASTLADTAALLRATPPEPDFPVTRGLGSGALVTRALRARLGATALVSNLGRLPGDGVRHLTFWPAASGPAGVALGLVTAGDTASLSLRARGPAFGPEAAKALLGLVREGLENA